MAVSGPGNFWPGGVGIMVGRSEEEKNKKSEYRYLGRPAGAALRRSASLPPPPFKNSSGLQPCLLTDTSASLDQE